MPAMLIVSAFLLLVLLPCVAAQGAQFAGGNWLPELDGAWRRRMRPIGLPAEPIVAMQPERQIADFAIRSFPKGLSQRRNLMRDGVSTVIAVASQWTAASSFVAAIEPIVPIVPIAPIVSIVPILPIALDQPAVYLSRRRQLMMQMLADKAEAEAWTGRADAAWSRVREAESMIAQGYVLDVRSLAEAARDAGDVAHRALARVTRTEALLQGRADVEMPLRVEITDPPVRESSEERWRAA